MLARAERPAAGAERRTGRGALRNPLTRVRVVGGPPSTRWPHLHSACGRQQRPRRLVISVLLGGAVKRRRRRSPARAASAWRRANTRARRAVRHYRQNGFQTAAAAAAARARARETAANSARRRAEHLRARARARARARHANTCASSQAKVRRQSCSFGHLSKTCGGGKRRRLVPRAANSPPTCAQLFWSAARLRRRACVRERRCYVIGELVVQRLDRAIRRVGRVRRVRRVSKVQRKVAAATFVERGRWRPTARQSL